MLFLKDGIRHAHFTSAAALIAGVSLIAFSADDMTARQPRLLARNSEGVALMAERNARVNALWS